MAKTLLHEVLLRQQEHRDIIDDHEVTLYGDAKRQIPGLVKDNKTLMEFRNKFIWMVIGGSAVSTAIGTIMTFIIKYLTS